MVTTLSKNEMVHPEDFPDFATFSARMATTIENGKLSLIDTPGKLISQLSGAANHVPVFKVAQTDKELGLLSV